MFKRFWRVIRSWFGGGLDKLEDPERLLREAQREMMNTVHAKNRERAIEVITRKNALHETLREIEKRAKQAGRLALEAEGKEDAEDARRLRREADEFRRTLEEARQRLAEAIATAEEVKQNIHDEEMKIRRRTAEQMAWKALHRNSEIQSEMRRQLRASGLWEDRQQVPPTEVTPRDLIIALAVCVLFVLSVSLVVTWICTR